MIKVICENTKFKKEIEYTFNVIQKIIGNEITFINDINKLVDGDVVINYGEQIIEGGNIINILSANLFTDLYLDIKSIPQKRLAKYKDIPIIYLGGKEIIKPYVHKENNMIVTNIDIIQSIFFMLTRYEEVVLWDSIEKDIYGRFPAIKSLAYKEKFLDIPIVNEYIEWLWKWIKSIGHDGERKNYFKNYDFVACLTHDVDMPFKYTNSLKKHLTHLRNRNNTFFKYREIVKHTISNINYMKDPFFTFDYIRTIEKKYNFSSSFYFMSGGNSSQENFYCIDDVRILELIKKLERDNCELGYHYSYNAYDNINIRKSEKEKLDNIFTSTNYGGRNHFLRFNPVESWKICEQVGLIYDSTLSYADYEGFRCGICFPYKPYDIKERRVINTWEIPLIVMEGTLKHDQYRNLNCDDAFEKIKNMIEVVKKYRGVFTLLWHNSSFDNENWSGWENIFEATMEYLYENNAIGISGINVINMINEEDNKYEKNFNN